MRPLLLELTGFRSYDRAEVDWEAHDVVVISGATGAGKTSLLDAIAFALYGRTPESARTGDLLRLGATHGEVRLTFGLGDERWRVTRRFGADAPEPAHALERLDDGRPRQVAVGDGPVGQAVGAMLGMSFDAFTSTVLLAQGRFTRFLRAAPAERDAILRELFGVASLESARQAALRARAECTARGDALAKERGRLTGHTPRVASEAAAAARSAASGRAVVRGLAPLARRVEERRSEAAAAERAHEALAAALARLPGRAEREELSVDLADAGARLTDAAAVRDAAEDARSRAAAELAGAVARHGGDAARLAGLREAALALARADAGAPALRERAAAARDAEREAQEAAVTAGTASQEAQGLATRLRRAVRMAERVEAATAARSEARTAAERALAALEQCTPATAAARTAKEACEDALRAGERAHAAAHLRVALSPGDPCPVCGGMLTAEAPAAPPVLTALQEDARRAAGALAAAEEAERRAAEATAAAQARLEAAMTALAAAEADLAGLGVTATPDEATEAERSAAAGSARAQEAAGAAGAAAAARRAADEALAAADAERRSLCDRLGDWAERPEPAEALARAMEEVSAREGALARATEAARHAAAAAEACGRRLAELERTRLAPLGAALAALAERLGAAPPQGDAAALLTAAEAAEQAATARVAVERRRAERAAADAAAAAAELRTRGAALGIADPSQVRPALRRAEEGVTAARARVAEIASAARTAARLAAEERHARADASRHDQVALDLRANRFPRFLLQRYRERLATSASARLEELTNRAYRFAGKDPDPLAVVDVLNGDRTRPASTLSGGESFLASLALALGLGDVAGGSGGRLDCLFLDEGFSTLDEESLEVALAAVERLGGGGRLVGVITHLPGVADRLGAEIRVRKDAAGTSRIVGADVSGA